MRASNILNTNVLICMDKDVAYVGSVNNRLKVWTIKCPNSEWAQCDCPVANEGMICKPTIKVFKMLHPGIEDGAIVHEASTRHGTQRDIPMKHCYAPLSQQTIESMFRTTWAASSRSNMWCRTIFYRFMLMKNTPF